MSTLLESIAAGLSRRSAATVAVLDGRPWLGRELLAGVAAAADQLRRAGVSPRDRVVLALPNGSELVCSFLGLLHLGAVAVPIAPESGAERIRRFAERSRARLIVAPASRLAALESLAMAAIAIAPYPTARLEPRPSSSDAELALIQFTSGSTGEPKGVAISHAQLADNIGQMVTGFELGADDVLSSWLPVHHDMGLILMTLTPLVLGIPFQLAPAGITGIRRWIETLATTRATFTAAPDFAYRLALRLSPAHASFDLGALRYALNAAEPVRASTIAAFEERFGLERIVQPGYGLAEATVGVTARAPGAPLLVDAKGEVALGRGFPGIELGIRDDRGGAADRGTVGEVVIRSPALAGGYMDDPAASALTWEPGGWLRTGDLGYLDNDDQLYVVGRRKDVLSVGGQTIAPRELEELVDRLDGVRRSAAVGLPGHRGEGELIGIFVEGAGSHRGREEQLVRVVNRTVREHLGFSPGTVVVLRPGSIPRTANAKIQRQDLVQLHSSGELHQRGLVTWP